MYILLSHHENDIKVGNIYFENVPQFKRVFGNNSNK
jgi:hypothetical protein